MQINYNQIADTIRSHMHVSLAELEVRSQFLNSLVQTGVNEAQFLARRYSFMQPKLKFVVSEDKSIVSLDVEYGVSGKTTIYTTEREVNKQFNVTVYIPDADQPLSSIEEELGLEGYRFSDEIREKKFSEFLTEQSPYSFDILITHDTLSYYAEGKVTVVLNYITLKDCIDGATEHLIIEGILDEQEAVGIYHLKDEQTDTPIAMRFRQYMTNQPSVTSPERGGR